jgi:ankyrin repeat protein
MQSKFKERLSYETDPQELEEFMKQNNLDHDTSTQEPKQPEEPVKHNRQQRTSLHDAAEFLYPNFAITFIEYGDDINAVDAKGRTPLHAALQARHEDKELQEQQEEVVRLLIQRGADVNIKDKDGLTPLHLAVLLRSETLAYLLMEAGANFRAEDAHGQTPFLFAYIFDEEDILDLFLETNYSKVEAAPSSTLRRHLVNLRPLAIFRSRL